MSRNILGAGLVLLVAGCVPTTEPLSDPTKAEPDKGLLGQWVRNNDTTAVDRPAVKGNPPGLMRAVFNDKPDDLKNTFWFAVSAVGKDRYMTVFLDPAAEFKFADFRREGAFAEYQKSAQRRYFIFRYHRDGDRLVVDGGNGKKVEALLAAEKVERIDNGFFKTPPGWLAKYLAAQEPGAIYDGSNTQEYQRAKK